MSDTETTDVPTELTDADALAEAVEGNEQAVAEFVERLDDVNDLLDLLDLGSAAMDDEMVVLLADTANAAGTLADTATEPETVRGLESLLHAVGDAAGDLDEPPERVGLVGLLRALRDPEVRAGMGFLVALARALGGDLERRSDKREG